MASFDVPIYGGRVVLCLEREEYDRAHRKLEGESYKYLDEVQGVSSKHASPGRTVYLVGVFKGGAQTLVHELVHTAFSILAHANVPVTKRNDEAYAYLVDHLYAKSIPIMRKARKG